MSHRFADLLPAIAETLRRDILDAWYPRAVDTGVGGFHQTFAADWQAVPDGKRGVVYQSRLTWVAAQAALHATSASEGDRWQQIALHGFDYLQTVLWDKNNGGFFFEVSPGGEPGTDRHGMKHAYGIAFGIYAACAVHEATNDARALALARQAFDYLETYSHDRMNGGYIEALSRDNVPVLTPPVAGQTDPIGTRFGNKSMNTHIHLLEAFTALLAADPSPVVQTRLAEVFHLVRDTIATPGYLHLYLTADNKPIPGDDSFGHDLETAFLLHEAAHALRNTDPRTILVAQTLVDHALQHGWDAQNGGFHDESRATGSVTRTRKVWWTQAEGLNALLLMHRLHGGGTPRYAEAFRGQWDFIAKHQIDPVNTGWRSEVAADGTPDPAANMSDFWKDPYHQARACFVVCETLAAIP